MLTSFEREQVLGALREWAFQTSDLPVMGFIGGDDMMTPREIVEAVEENSDDGAAVLEMLEHGIRREGLEAVVERLKRPAATDFVAVDSGVLLS